MRAAIQKVAAHFFSKPCHRKWGRRHAHICKDKLAAMKYVCQGCGRVAMEEGHLCKPEQIV